MQLILIRGLPGSGKSTIARQFAALGFAHYEADMFFTAPDGSYSYDPARAGEAHSWCLCQAIAALAAGRDVVVANTFTRRYELASYRAVAEALGADVEIMTVRGQHESVHGVPPAVIAAMRARWEE